jgi:hypothetical protein
MGAIFTILRGLLAALGAVLGRVWGVRSEAVSRRRELRVVALIEAWRKVERASMRGDAERMLGLEEALADIQLFGTPSQVARAASVVRSMNDGTRGTDGLGELLQALREELRGELHLAQVDGPPVSLRATPWAVPRARGTASAGRAGYVRAVAGALANDAA